LILEQRAELRVARTELELHAVARSDLVLAAYSAGGADHGHERVHVALGVEIRAAVSGRGVGRKRDGHRARCWTRNALPQIFGDEWRVGVQRAQRGLQGVGQN